MKKLTFFTVFSLVLIFHLSAQQSAFTVILSKGDNTHGIDQVERSIVIGETLKNSEHITLGKDGYMALVHDQSGMSLELKEAGKYQVKDLEQKIREQSNTVLSKYGKFLMSKLNPEGTGNQNLNVTGAVERGDEEYINVYLPMVTDVYGDDMLIAWQQADDVADYVLTIKNSRDEIIAEKRISGTKYRLSFNESPLNEMKLLIINLRADTDQQIISKEYGINRITEEQKKNIQSEYEDLLGEVDADNVINKLLIATFFEENELLGDAIYYYDQAWALSPDADGFGKLYNNFLYRNKLK
jgi:hypothetical protein